MVETHPLPNKRKTRVYFNLDFAKKLLGVAMQETERYSQLRTDIGDAIQKVEEAIDILDA